MPVQIPGIAQPYNVEPIGVDLPKIDAAASQNALRNVQTQTAQQGLEGVNALRNVFAQPGTIGPDGMLTPQGARNALAASPVLGAQVVDHFRQMQDSMEQRRLRGLQEQKLTQDMAWAVMPEIHSIQQQMFDKEDSVLKNTGDPAQAKQAAQQLGYSLMQGGTRSGTLSPLAANGLARDIQTYDRPTLQAQMQAEKNLAMRKEEQEGTAMVSDKTGEHWLVNRTGQYLMMDPETGTYAKPSVSRTSEGGGGAPRIPTDLRPVNQSSPQMKIDLAGATAAARTAGTIEAQGGGFAPDELKFMAKQVWTGDTTPFQNLGRGVRAGMNAEALRKAVIQEGVENGKSPEELAAKNAEFKGIMAGERTLGTRQANIEMAITEAENLIPLALAASADAKRSGIRSVNRLMQFVQGETASPELRRLAGATNSLINVYARAVNPQGVPTVSDKNHAREVLDKGFADGDYQAAVDQLHIEMEAAGKSPGQVRQKMRESITGVPAATSAAAPASTGSAEIRITPDGRRLRKNPDGTIEELK